MLVYSLTHLTRMIRICPRNYPFIYCPGNAIVIASKSPCCPAGQIPFWRGDRTDVCHKEGKAWAAPVVKREDGGRGGRGNPFSLNKDAEGTAALRASCIFCSTPSGSVYSGPPFGGVSHSTSLSSELSGLWRGSKMDFISAQVDQIDTGKGTPLQRSFSDSLSTFSHVPKSKYQEKGTTSNVSRWFVKAPIAGPHLFLFPSLLEPALRPIYMASIVPSYLNFPCLTPVSVPERVLLTAEGDF